MAGSSIVVPGGPQHAFLWFGRNPLVDLGTLGGAACPNCNSGADGPNGLGEAPVGSEIAETDPNNEDFCGYNTHLQCRAAIWNNGKLSALPNLPGGNNANAFEINNLSQVVGFAEDGKSDPTCVTAYQKQRFQAVIWNPGGEPPLALKRLPGDTVAFAIGINDRGQVVGTSGLCSNTSLPPVNPFGPHAVLWDRDGTPQDLGNLGGCINVATSLNSRGDVVGAASVQNGDILAFLWTRDTGKMRDLGSFPGAFVTVAPCCDSINNRREVVGFAVDGSGMRAILWQPGYSAPTDLNTLIPAGSPWFLEAAVALNDAGEIVGWGMINGETHAFLAMPVDGASESDDLSPAAASIAPRPALANRRGWFRLAGR